ncbi:hypothetical protein [Glycomyces harbinensis]|uniref:Ribose/xylose/arabinose/galactoside ABC-type transport system, permease component n=1 Tax=Glycomyces harbinensis TaxID=58114 RepID=A0A1G6YW51_9ACTN|nr:hypothetical protein [Glycomyces harbinensis]SDD94293.1 Ribose/xylose/arabinose/galactoside ABC-type transport system, permease component [Glycomyces harbinensis]
MTYVPPERDEPALDQTRQLDFTPPPAAPGTGRPAVGNGVDSQPVDPFAGREAEPLMVADERPRRDRVVFQFVWGAILLLLTLNALFLIYRREDELFGGEFDSLLDAFDRHALYLTPVLLAALAIGMSLRLGAVNLAVPALAFAVTMATPVETNIWLYLAYVAGAAVAAGLLYVLLAVAFRVPPWFAGLAVGVLILAALPVVDRLAPRESYSLPGMPNGFYLFGGTAVLAVAGGLIGLSPRVRDGFSAVKRMTDGEERSAPAVFLLLGGTILSMLLAAGSGYVVYVFALGPIEGANSLNFGPYGAYPTGVELQVLAFAIVLIGGTSLWGRSGGVLGVVLATIAVWAGLVLWGQAVEDAGEGSWQADYSQAIFAGVLLLGLFVSFGLDRLGRPKEPVEEEEFPPFQGEMQLYEPQNGMAPAGTGLFEPTLPDANAQRQ